ncbi:MAG: transposase-like protein [Gemmatimonadetes bacterium]|jgi:transposase|nr:transposase-like protein [Gemmatimonadota bacterium]
MSIRDFQRFVRSETTAANLIHRYRFGEGAASRGRLPLATCPRCATRGAYALASGRWRCGACGYTFGLLTGTWLEACRFPAQTWLWTIKLFELELVAQQAGVQLGLSYPTILRAFTTIRRALLAAAEPTLFQQEVEADESYFGPRKSARHRGQKRGRGAPAKIPVFGILERHGRVQVTVVPDCSAESLLRETLRTVKRGSLVYTDRWAGYDTLAFCGYRHLRVDHSKEFSRPSSVGKVHINGLEGFWSYAKGKLLKHHGVSPQKFPLYLYEMQFRYNHRHQDLFTLLLQILVQPVPDLL